MMGSTKKAGWIAGTAATVAATVALDAALKLGQSAGRDCSGWGVHAALLLSLAWAAVLTRPRSWAEFGRTALIVAAVDYLVLLYAGGKGMAGPAWFRGYAVPALGAALGIALALMLVGQQMSWIALKMLTGDKAKFFGIVLGLTFAALLITQQGSIFCGLMRRTAGQVEDIRGADLWVMDPNVRYIDDVKPMLGVEPVPTCEASTASSGPSPCTRGTARLKLKATTPAIDPETKKPAIDPATGELVMKPLDVIEQVILLGLDDESLVGAPAGRAHPLRQPRRPPQDGRDPDRLQPVAQALPRRVRLGPRQSARVRQRPPAMTLPPDVEGRLPRGRARGTSWSSR